MTNEANIFYSIINSLNGDIIEIHPSIKQCEEKIKQYEIADLLSGFYTENFYKIEVFTDWN